MKVVGNIKKVATIIIPLLVVLIVYLNCGLSQCERKGPVDMGTFLILSLTLLVLIHYAADTYIIAKDSEANTRERNLQKSNQKKKHAIWGALEQKEGEIIRPCKTIDQLAAETRVDVKELEELIFEMIQEGIISEGSFPRTYTRYREVG